MLEKGGSQALRLVPKTNGGFSHNDTRPAICLLSLRPDESPAFPIVQDVSW